MNFHWNKMDGIDTILDCFTRIVEETEDQVYDESQP